MFSTDCCVENGLEGESEKDISEAIAEPRQDITFRKRHGSDDEPMTADMRCTLVFPYSWGIRSRPTVDT